MSSLPVIKSRALTLTHEIPVARINRFWEGLSRGEIYATKCNKCGEIYYPPQVDCFRCLASDVEWIALSNEGFLETFTGSQLVPQGFTHYDRKSYIIAIARVPENVKIMGWLEDIDVDKVKVGMKVKIEVKTQTDGYPVITFRPAE